ncbi:MAG: hypothetical protein R6X02_04980 [Enhygromyxa sp.]
MGILVAVVMSRASRLSPLLVSLILLSVPGCEPDECDLSLVYAAGGGSHSLTWAAPSAECSFTTSSVLGTRIDWKLDNSSFEIQLPAPTVGDHPTEVGVHPVDLIYRDANAKTWYTSEGGFQIPASDCVASISAVEFVDWVTDDHYRIRGTVTCTGPLVDVSFGDIAGANQLQFSDVKFNVYVGEFGY